MIGLDRTLRVASEKLRAVPVFEKTALVTDDAVFAAQISSLFRRPGRYFPVLDGPRMGRQDAENEVIRRRNALAKTRAGQVLLSGLPREALQAFTPDDHFVTVSDVDHAAEVLRGRLKRPKGALHWGTSNLGVGLYLARNQSKELVCDLAQSPAIDYVEKGRHLLVACELGDPHAEVVASNLAFGFNASFRTFPELAEEEREEWIHDIYALGEGNSKACDIEMITNRALRHLGAFDVAGYGTVLWITAGFPWGIAFPSTPSTHLNRYPDLGRSVIEGLWASQSSEMGSRVALLVDPGKVGGSEIPVVNRALLTNGCLTQVLRNQGAAVAEVNSAINLLPYDIIVLSSHAGDAPGERITYEFNDYEGRRRKLVVDEAVGFGFDPHEQKVMVTTYSRFHALDGVSWRDKPAKAALPVGSAIRAWSEIEEPQERRSCIVKREPISRVVGSMGIQLHDGVWFFVSHGFSPKSAPLVVNNACWSWHEISERAMYAGARGYMGCLVPILGPEAERVSEGVFERYLGIPLPIALWASQRDAYEASLRRPYVLVGLPCISVPFNGGDSVAFWDQAIAEGVQYWSKLAARSVHEDQREVSKRHAEFLGRKLDEFRRSVVRRPMPRDRRPLAYQDSVEGD